MNDDNEEPLKKRSKVVQNPLEQPSHDVAISASDEARTADAAIPVMSPELSTMDFSQRVVWGKYDLNHPLPLVPLDAEPVFSDASPALCHYVHAVSGRARACTMHLRAQPGQQVPTTTNTTTPCEDSYSLETRPVPTPIFMPVGTKGCLKALAFHEWMQDPALQCPIILANTYHLAIQPGTELIDEMGGLHAFQGLPNLEKNNASNTDANETDSVLPYNLLTDSGGFQMVSLVSLSQVSEEGVSFENPYNSTRKSKAANSSSAGKNSERWNDLQSPEPNEANPTSSDGDLLLLRPEDSIRHQHRIRANIIMALDDVVSSVQLDEQRMITATHRTLRWYDRCYKVHHEAQPQQYHLDDGSNNENKESFRIPAHTQNLFPIVQGGLDIALGGLREQCLAGFRHREVNQQYITPGYAIGGLAGGENKDDFWRVIDLCCRALPDSKPRYLMGVGYPLDLVVCTALGVDMFDCVYPTRTARFGVALVPGLAPGTLRLKSNECFDASAPLTATTTEISPSAMSSSTETTQGMEQITSEASSSNNFASQVLQDDCLCQACRSGISKHRLHTLFKAGNTVAVELLTQHNVAYMMALVRKMRQAILDDCFPDFCTTFVREQYPGPENGGEDVPKWVVDALEASGIRI